MSTLALQSRLGVQHPAQVVLRKPVGLALQGGGSWGAYTWGVLDALLASRSVSIAQFSGTSAGAINAAIVAGALAGGSAGEARRRLRAFWLTIARPAVADLGREVWGPMERQWRETVSAWLVSTGGMSPYTANPLGLNPLRDAISAHVDIDAIRSAAAPPLYVTVTNVRSGLPRVFGNEAMTIDVLLASACLPELFQAIEIDGEPYWDGGYCGNPTLWPMIDAGAARDLIVVQLAPDDVADLPTGAAAIRQRIGEIVFHSSLVAEMQSIHAMRTMAAGNAAGAGVRDLRLHRIGPPRTALFGEGSALERSRAWIERLHAEGRAGAKQFLARHGSAIGERETLDIGKVFVDGRKPRPRALASEDRSASPAAPGSDSVQ